jgi:hypothetical protein
MRCLVCKRHEAGNRSARVSPGFETGLTGGSGASSGSVSPSFCFEPIARTSSSLVPVRSRSKKPSPCGPHLLHHHRHFLDAQLRAPRTRP